MLIAGAIVVLLVQRPVTTPDLWWHLSRGRAVFAGSISPARDLLELETAREADWLGGAPFYLAHSIAGHAGLGMLPLTAAVGLLLLLRRRLRRDRAAWKTFRWPAMLLGLPLVLWVVRDGLQPVPALFDLLGMLTVWNLLHSDRRAGPQPLVIALTFAVWANLGPRPVWGLLVLVALCPPERFSLRLPAAALIGGCLSPRGLWTWRDASVLFAPSVWSPGGAGWPAGWTGLFSPLQADWATLGFVLLWSLWVVCGWPQRWELLRPIRWSVPLLAALLSRANLPACGLWIVLDVCSSPDTARSLSFFSARRWLVPVGLVMGGLIALDAAGRGLPPYDRLGGGIAQQLDYRLLDTGFLELSQAQTPTGWAPDGRSVGTACWALPKLQMVDHPQRALLGKRLRRHADLRADLLSAHRAAYRRDDGSWGGWVRTLAGWKIDFLLVPMEDVDLNSALVETPWRPLDLDSPTVPYVDADQLGFADMIVEVMRQQAFVEVGPWQPTAQIYAGRGWRWDLPELVGGALPADPAIRQSQLFRALRLPLASLRALRPVQAGSPTRHLQREFFLCQNQLAYQEWFTFGQSSRFRRMLVQRLQGSQPDAEPPAWITPVAAHGEADSADDWDAPLRLYLAGRLPEAARQLAGGDAQQQYAAAMIWLEWGDPAQALQQLQRLEHSAPEEGLRIAAAYWMQQIEEFGRQQVSVQATSRRRGPS